MKRLKNLGDLRRYLAGLINRLDSGEVDSATASKLAYICSILHRILVDSEIEDRITALEKRLNEREARENARK